MTTPQERFDHANRIPPPPAGSVSLDQMIQAVSEQIGALSFKVDKETQRMGRPSNQTRARLVRMRAVKAHLEQQRDAST